MPALNFKAEFAEAVESGQKRQTIRRRRKRPVRPGEVLYFYAGMRTRRCRPLGKAVCLGVEPVVVGDGRVTVNGKPLNPMEVCDLARADGFGNTELFVSFFREHYGLPFEGVLIRW